MCWFFSIFFFFPNVITFKFVDLTCFFSFFARVFLYLYVSYTDQLKCANILCRRYAMPMIPCWCICIRTRLKILKLGCNSHRMKDKSMLVIFISIPNLAWSSLIKDVKVFRLQTLNILFFICFFKNPIQFSYMHKTI